VPLRDIQRGFAAGIFSDDASLIQRRIGPSRFGAARHLQVYRNNVYTSLTDALEAVYPVVARLVGADCFRGCGYHYVRYAPPASGNLHDFGAQFADFLATFPPVRALAYLPDVARLEWARHSAYHAADAPTFELGALARVTPDQYTALQFDLHPSVHLLATDYPLLHIWRINQPDAPPEETVDLSEGGVKLLVARRNLVVEIEAIDEGEYALLRGFAERQSFADAAAAAVAMQADFDLTESLRRRVQDQTIVRFNTN
jgi:Putative DNA-binding domain